MVDDLNEIGAGLSEYLISLKQNYALGNDLAAVMDSYYNGELNRPWISSNPNLSHLSMHDEVARMKQAWEVSSQGNLGTLCRLLYFPSPFALVLTPRPST